MATPNRGVGAWLAVFLAACSATESAPPRDPSETGPEPSALPPDPSTTVRFRYPKIGGGELTSDELRGRVTLVLLVTTYDVASHAEARFIEELLHETKPRINAVIIALEHAENLPLIEAFARTLKLDAPIVLGDAAAIRGEGAFPGLKHVPSIVIIDPQGHERFRHVGFAKKEAIAEALERVQSGQSP